uniref:SWIM-type domain-containing protein n=1 Tax=Kalanchoe fedtschenkoi TaxID=63787 RepID=A0A7N0TSA9_KALFE
MAASGKERFDLNSPPLSDSSPSDSIICILQPETADCNVDSEGQYNDCGNADTNPDNDPQHQSANRAVVVVPECDQLMKPFHGKKFNNLQEGIDFYKEYAHFCGFQVRVSTSKKAKRCDSVYLQYVLCNKEGFHSSKFGDRLEDNASVAQRRRSTARSGCKARVLLKLVENSLYVVSDFVEEHNHPMTPLVHQQFLKSNRSVNCAQQNFIMDCGNLRIGAQKSHKIMKEICGGYSNIGAQAVDFKNFKRDFKNFVGDSDGQIVIDRLKIKQSCCDGFRFEYHVDSNGDLRRLLWADALSQIHFQAFGDCVAFDATYRTNKYNLVFVPFTGVDNHKSCISFAGALLSNEDVESYEWLLESFRKVLGSSPRIWVTDQDPAMRIAIKRVFPDSIHRLCMWHITKKFTDKVNLYHCNKCFTMSIDVRQTIRLLNILLHMQLGTKLCRDKDFLHKLNGIVWNGLIEPDEFDTRWEQIIDEYNLEENKWLADMYEMRSSWIPAFFRDIHMGGLLRTTSRSESENSFFNGFLHSGMNLTEFFMAFESAMDAQRHRKEQLDHESESTYPPLKTSLPIEKHAAEIYTRRIFFYFQTEFYEACVGCHVSTLSEKDGVKFYDIKDKSSTQQVVKVVHYTTSDYVECSCKNYQRIGIPCRHILLALNAEDVDKIPEKFIQKRWTKYAVHIQVTTLPQC